MSIGKWGLATGLATAVAGLAWAAGASASGEPCRDGWCPRPGVAHERSESCESYCTRFSACSIERNLASADGAELERYRAEKAEDGREYADWPAPAIDLPTLAGDRTSLSAPRGGPVVLVTLAAHCEHSYETLPVLEALQQKYRADGVSFLGVYVSSGTPADVRDSTEGIDLSFPIAVDSRAELAAHLDSRMVPSAFLIDADGRIRRKLVGFKHEAALASAIEALQAS